MGEKRREEKAREKCAAIIGARDRFFTDSGSGQSERLQCSATGRLFPAPGTYRYSTVHTSVSYRTYDYAPCVFRRDVSSFKYVQVTLLNAALSTCSQVVQQAG